MEVSTKTAKVLPTKNITSLQTDLIHEFSSPYFGFKGKEGTENCKNKSRNKKSCSIPTKKNTPKQNLLKLRFVHNI